MPKMQASVTKESQMSHVSDCSCAFSQDVIRALPNVRSIRHVLFGLRSPSSPHLASVLHSPAWIRRSCQLAAYTIVWTPCPYCPNPIFPGPPEPNKFPDFKTRKNLNPKALKMLWRLEGCHLLQPKDFKSDLPPMFLCLKFRAAYL